MMYKWQRQNNHIIFQCNLPVHQHTYDICQKVLLFQSNRIPGHVSRYDSMACYSSSLSKTSFHKGAASDVEICISRCRVSGRVSKVGETAAQTRCPWLWPVQLETCAPEHYRAATADLGSELPSASPSLPDADLSALHRSMVQSLLSSVVVIHQQHAFAIRQIVAITFSADVECGTPWAEESWRASTASTLVWCLDPSGESKFCHQLLYGTTRCPGLQCR